MISPDAPPVAAGGHPRPPAPLYRQIYDRFRGAIASGVLKPGDRIPSVRALTRNWAWRAGPSGGLFLLAAEGYIQPPRPGRHDRHAGTQPAGAAYRGARAGGAPRRAAAERPCRARRAPGRPRTRCASGNGSARRASGTHQAPSLDAPPAASIRPFQLGLPASMPFRARYGQG